MAPSGLLPVRRALRPRRHEYFRKTPEREFCLGITGLAVWSRKCKGPTEKNDRQPLGKAVADSFWSLIASLFDNLGCTSCVRRWRAHTRRFSLKALWCARDTRTHLFLPAKLWGWYWLDLLLGFSFFYFLFQRLYKNLEFYFFCYILVSEISKCSLKI